MRKFKIIKSEDADKLKDALEIFLSVKDEKIKEVCLLSDKLPFQKTSHNVPLRTKIATEISRATGLDKKDSRNFLGTFVSLARFVDKESSNGLKADMKTLGFKPSDIQRIHELLLLFKKKGFDKAVTKQDATYSLFQSVLPYLSGSSWECDIRYAFEGKKVKTKIPIALLRLDLDTDDEEKCTYVRFQIDAEILKMFIKDLREMYNRLILLERMENCNVGSR